MRNKENNFFNGVKKYNFIYITFIKIIFILKNHTKNGYVSLCEQPCTFDV